jgi:hypothetical protein
MWTNGAPSARSSASLTHRLDAAPVDRAHAVDRDAQLRDQGALARIEIAPAEDGDAFELQRRQCPGRALEPWAAASERGGRGIPCTLPLGVVSGVLRSPCASSHNTAPGPYRAARPPAC